MLLYLYFAIVLAVAIERLVELRISKKHEEHLKAQGGFEVGREHFIYMKLMHSAFLVSCLVEAWLKGHEPSLLQFVALTAVVLLTQSLRYWVIKTLGTRWTVNIMVLPNAPLVTHGPFRWLRHPNYVAVVIEIIALPMIFNGYYTAVIFSVLNALVLAVRIKREEAALGG